MICGSPLLGSHQLTVNIKKNAHLAPIWDSAAGRSIVPRGGEGGRVGPDPTPSFSIDAAISSRSVGFRVSVAASIQPSTCDGDLLPTIAPVTAGHDSVHASATAATVVSCLFAIGLSESRSARFFSSQGVWKFDDFLRQSSGAICFTRSAEKESVRMPACMGL